VEPAVLVQALSLDPKPSNGEMPRLRRKSRPLEIVPLAALVERLTVLAEFAPVDPPLRVVRDGPLRKVPRSEPADRDWLAARDGSAPVLIPFGGRNKRQHTGDLEHEFWYEHTSDSDTESESETASEMYK
jgi:hypothetical protein